MTDDSGQAGLYSRNRSAREMMGVIENLLGVERSELAEAHRTDTRFDVIVQKVPIELDRARPSSRLNQNLPKAMVGAIIKAEEKVAVIEQLREYGPKRFLVAMNDWILNRELPVEDRRFGKWKIWLEECGPFLSKLKQREQEAARKAAREVAINDDIERQMWANVITRMKHRDRRFDEYCSAHERELLQKMDEAMAGNAGYELYENLFKRCPKELITEVRTLYSQYEKWEKDFKAKAAAAGSFEDYL